MCGIWAILGADYEESECKPEFMRIAGRGPDLTVVSKVAPKCWLGFHRLAIVQPGNVESAQPIVNRELSVVCNGEIYNHEELKLRSPLDNNLVKNGGSDCAAILHAFRLHSGDLRKCCEVLDGVFAFVMVDDKFLYMARDPIGVRPLFYGTNNNGFIIGSEVKCIEKLCDRVDFFPPGCCAQIPLIKPDPENLQILPYYSIPTHIERNIETLDAQNIIRKLLIDSVEKRLMGNRLFGFMLSGGLDSSLIASIASRFLLPLGKRPIAFSVGFEDSPDLENARHVAKYLNIEHRILVISPEDCIQAIPDVIYAMETFDPLLVRCGVAHYLLCKFIATSSDVKILLSGEGADELFGSYAYMQRAPNHAHLQQEILRRLRHLHQYDVLRCDRSTSCHGLEIRVPFLDKKFIEFVTCLPPSYKLMEGEKEKYLLRSAFTGCLPDEVLWRSKEGFSEALGKIDLGECLLEYVGKLIPDEQYAQKTKLFPWNTPQSKEELWYRAIFEGFFDLNKVNNLIHTNIYRTAAWHVNADQKQFLSVPNEELSIMEDPETRFRRRSTGSAVFGGGLKLINIFSFFSLLLASFFRNYFT